MKHLSLGPVPPESAPKLEVKPTPRPVLDDSQPTPATIPPGTIRGVGTKEDPLLPPVEYRVDGKMRQYGNYPVRQCTTSTCGLWFKPKANIPQKRCYKCKTADPEVNQRHYFTPHEITKLEVKAAETWAEFRARLKALGLNTIPEDADRRKARNFGVYGDIMCTWREMAAARLIADGNHVVMVADAVAMPAASIFDMMDGVGGQPRFQDMVAHFHAVDIGLQMLHRERSLRKTVSDAEGLTPKQKVDAEIQLSKLHTEVSERLPKPPKAKEIDFGLELEAQGLRNIARGMAADFSLLVSGNLETGAVGGPGPRK